MYQTLNKQAMKRLRSGYFFFIIYSFLSCSISLPGQISGPGQVIISSNVSYTHSLSPAAPGFSYVWEADEGDMVFEAWDSMVVGWDTSGDYAVWLSLLDSRVSLKRLSRVPMEIFRILSIFITQKDRCTRGSTTGTAPSLKHSGTTT